MLHLACKLPHDCYIAFSGGSDSSALLHFALANPKRKVKLVHVVYEDYPYHLPELYYVRNVAKKYNLGLLLYYAERNPGNLTKEYHWSNERNNFFNTLDKPVLTAHNLDDALEWFLLTATKGDMIGRLIPIVNKNVQRPLLFTTKKAINNYITNNSIEWFSDKTNNDTSIPRNNIRHNVIPHIRNYNPGIYTSLLNKYKTTTP